MWKSGKQENEGASGSSFPDFHIPSPDFNVRSAALFVAEGVDGVELGGFSGGVEAEEDADGGAEDEGDDDGRRRDEDGPAVELGDELRAADADEDADDSAEGAEDDGLDQELHEDIAAVGADGEADADLARALGDGDEHDIHNPDTADNERDAGDGAEEDGHGFRGGGGGFGELDLVADGEVGFATAAALGEQVVDFLLNARNGVGGGGADENRVDVRAAGEPFHVARIGNDHDVVLVGAEEVEAFFGEDADDLERDVADADGLADRVDSGEELFGDGFTDDGDLADAADVLFGEDGAVGDGPAADVGIIGRGAEDLGVPVEAVAEDLAAVADLGGDAEDVGDFGGDGGGVFGSERGRAAPTAASAAGGEVAGENAHDVLAEGGDLGFDLGFGAVADADHRDDRADADDDTERGEDGAQLVAAEGAEGDDDGGAEAHEEVFIAR